MNPEVDKLLKQLEMATAEGERREVIPPPDSTPMANRPQADLTSASPLEVETALLRESWEWLGRLLENADRDYLQQDGAERECASLKQSIREAQVPSLPPRTSLRRDGYWAWVLASVACLAVVCSLGWYIRLNGPDSLMASPGSLAGSAPAIDGSGGDRAGEDAPEVSNVADLAWDDAFDDRLDRLRSALRQVDGSASRGDLRWKYMPSDVREMNEEIAEGSL